MKEILKTLIKFGFKELQLDIIYGVAYSHNTLSCKVMTGCGMRQYKDGYFNNYQLSREEYFAQAA